jgi:hypothetical protein
MSAFCIVPLAAAFVAVATAAAAQTPAAKVEPAPVLEFGAMSPVMDREILPTSSLTSSRAASAAATPSSAGRDKDGSAAIIISCGSNRRVRSAMARSTTASISSSTAVRSRPISICRGDCAAISTHGPPAIGRPSVSRALPPTFSISRPPALSAGKVISPPNSRPPTIFCSPSG